MLLCAGLLTSAQDSRPRHKDDAHEVRVGAERDRAINLPDDVPRWDAAIQEKFGPSPDGKGPIDLDDKGVACPASQGDVDISGLRKQ